METQDQSRGHDRPYGLPERLRGVVLPEISRIHDLATHTGLPGEWFVAELKSGRLPGIKVADEWLVHRRAIEHWLRARLDEERPLHGEVLP